MADDFIVKLSHYGLLGIKPTSTSRRMLWEKVFRGNWKTTKMIPPIPSKRPTRPISNAALPIGTILEDLSEGAGGHRRAGADALIRPQVSGGSSDIGIILQWVDGNGRTLPGSKVRVDEARSLGDHIQHAVEHFDGYEVKRVNDWNIIVAVSWLRRRLLMLLEELDNTSTRAARAINAPPLENEGDLIQLVSVLQRLREMKELLAGLDDGAEQKYDDLTDGSEVIVIHDSDSDDNFNANSDSDDSGEDDFEGFD